MNFSNGFTDFWWLLALSAPGFYAFLSLVILIARRRLENKKNNGGLNIFWKWIYESITEPKITQRVSNITYVTLGLFVGFAWGYATKELKQFDNTDTLYNIKIISSLPEREYVYEMPNHQQYQTKFCNDFDPKFPKGTTLEFVHFENKVNCWSVADKKFGYKYKRGE